jgi:nitrate reductase gamma subunit
VEVINMAGAILYSYILYLAFLIFVAGFMYRVMRWASIPVPINITTTGRGYLDNPQTRTASVLRMATEAFLFRSLFRNTRYDLETNEVSSNRVLWLGAMAFHVSFLLIVIRHFRLVLEPFPGVLATIRAIEAVGPSMPGLNWSSLLIVLALSYLLVRRVINPELKYISILGDYLVVLLIISIAFSGIIVAYYKLVGIVAVKAWLLNLVAFNIVAPSFHWFFYVHLILVSTLLVYFPWSKLMHAPGVFFSPTRNQVNDPRTRRHKNPWNYPVIPESFADYKEKYKDALKDVEE